MVNNKKFWTEGYGSIMVAIFIALVIRWALMEAYVIPSASMFPSLLIHDHIFVNKLKYGVRVPFSEQWLVRFSDPKRGEVIVFKYPLDKSTFFIKRVVGLPGDKVYYEYDNDKLYINDQLVETETPQDKSDFDNMKEIDFRIGSNGFDSKENYNHFTEKLGEHPHSILLRREESPSRVFGPKTVPEGHLYVMGDNRDNSQDSRQWGFVPYENILGRAMFVWLSCEETLPVITFLCDPTSLRWKRLLHSIH